MQKITHTLILLMVSLTVSLGQGFITTWEVSIADPTITIPTTGTGYNYSVNWGDGTTQTGFVGNASHTYAGAGIFTVEITGDFPRIYFNFSNTGNDRQQIKTIEQWGNIVWTNMSRSFAGCTQLTYNATDAPNLSGVNDMGYMFANAINFNGAINNWDISNVINLGNMFENAQKFNQPLNAWNTVNVQSMQYMFWKAFVFNQNISSWNLSSLINMTGMFKEASVFNQNIGVWNVSNVTLADAMFQSATSFNQDISGWNVSNFIRFSSMFAAATSFNQNISSWNTSGANSLTGMFSGATSFNQDISGWDVSNITNMSIVFNNATSFDQNLSAWDISNATDMTNMLSGSALSLSNYDNTIIGWAALLSVQPNVTLGATGLSYCNAANARTALINNSNWSFSGDTPDCPSFNTTWSTGAAGESVIIPTIGIGYDYYVDWGDGNIDYNVTGNASHSYATPGTHTVKIYGNFPRIFFNGGGHLVKIRSIEQWGDNQWESMESAFYGCSNLVNNATDAPDLSQVTSLAGMFRNASNFNADLSNWDVSTITDMSNMFDNTLMSYYNYDNTLVGWAAQSVQSNVTLGALNVPYCESENTARNTLINSKTWTIAGDKKGCPFITTWETNPSKQVVIPVTGSGYKYYVEWGDGTSSLHYNANAQHTYATAGTYTVKISGDFPRFNGISYANPYIKTIEQWGNIHWTSMYQAFRGCSELTSNATDAPDLSNVTILTEMFYLASSFDGDVSLWDVSNVTNMNSMFQNASSFNGDVSGWDVSSVIYFNSMFYNASSFNGDVSGWDVSQATNMSYMFGGTTVFNSNISGWDVSQVTNMSNMFRASEAFDQPIGNWNVANVTTMSSMFLDAHTFNQNISGWNVTKVTDMSDMFNSAHAFNQPIGNWDVSNLNNMGYMFSDAWAFNQPIGNWDLGNALAMEAMFFQATSFDQDLSNWDLTNGPDIFEMFSGATSFNQDISGWDVSFISDLTGMFNGATSFNQNLSAWDISNVTFMDNMFDNSGMSRRNYDQTLIEWEALPSLQANVNVGANGLLYCVATTAHAQLIANNNWTFTGDLQDCANTASTDINLSKNSIPSNNAIGAIIGILTTVDDDVSDTFTYSLVAGTGDTDNASFTINGNQLLAAEVFDITIKSEYTIRIQSDDWIDTFEKSFIITITEEDLTAPAVVILSPANNAVDISINPSLVITYDEGLVAGSGIAEIKEVVSGTVVASFDISAATINVNELSFTLSIPLDYGTQYSVIIPATYVKDANANFSSAIDGGWVFTTLKSNQSITFGALANVTYGDANFDLTATASSGLGVTYLSSDQTVATIAGTTITIVGAGTTTITASQAGDQIYNAAADVTQQLVVAKAAQNISLASIANKSTTDVPFDIVASASSSLGINLSISGPASISGTTVTLDGTAGTVTVTASQLGDVNYNAAVDTIVSFEVIENRTPQTITFAAIGDQFLEEGTLALGATASSGLVVSYTIVSGPVTVSGGTVTFTGLGTVTVSASQAGDNSFFAATAVEQSFNIITVTGVDNEASALHIYPNPATNYLNVEIQNSEQAEVSLLSLNGKEIMRMDLQKQIDISHLDKGVYFLRVITPSKISTHKIIKN